MEVDDGAGVAKCLLKIFLGNINFPNFLRQASQCLASESLTELVYLVICVDSILGSSGEPVPEYDKILTCKPCKGGELDVARLVIHGVVLVVFNKVVLVCSSRDFMFVAEKSPSWCSGDATVQQCANFKSPLAATLDLMARLSSHYNKGQCLVPLLSPLLP